MKYSDIENAIEKENLTISAVDGFRLAATLFRGRTDDEPLAIIAAATAVQRSYYEKFAQFLAQNGFHALTFDYRGIGSSRPENHKGFHAEMHEWGALDLAGVIDWITAVVAPSQILLVGHSVAGQIFPFAKNNHRVSAAYFVASQSAYWKLWNGKERATVFALWHFSIPLATKLFGYLPGWVLGNGEDLPAGVAREWARWARHPDYLLSHDVSVWKKFQRVNIPLKFMSFTDDALIAPKRAVQAIASWYGSADKEYRHIHPKEIGAKAIGHFGFFRESFRETLWQEALAWLKTRAFATAIYTKS
ncbi:alpha/beta fold hydrolase [candidate division KSB1 bacterium]|nr:alpha/beta fold hydrolase [candidate division KSB1 bacterium]